MNAMHRAVMIATMTATLLTGLGPARAAIPFPAGAASGEAPTATGEMIRLGPGDRLLGVSPDGQWLASAGPADETLCTWRTEDPDEAHTCVDLVGAGLDSLAFRSIAWSPDSTQLAFGDEGISFLRDGDIYVMDVASGELTDVTDDGFEGRIRNADDGPVLVDSQPAWSPDGSEIAFARSEWSGLETTGTALMRVSAGGGEPIMITPVAVDPEPVRETVRYTPDGQSLLYTVFVGEQAGIAPGVWSVPVAGGEPELVAGPLVPGGSAPRLLDIAPDGGRALVAWARRTSSAG